jgi:hypothetical protein
MRPYSAMTGVTGIARYARAIAQWGTLAIVVGAAAVAHAQFRAIPNYVGVGAGLQFRNDINNHFSGAATIAPRIASLPFAQLPTEQEAQEYWCPDCQQTNPCQGAGHGALALGSQGQWSCTSGATLPNGFPLSLDVSAGAHRIKSLAPNSTTGDALSQGQSHLNDLTTASASYNMGANRLQNLGSAATNGDALSYGQSGAILSGLNLNTHTATGLAPATANGQALAFAQNGAQLTTNQPSIAAISTIENSGGGTPFVINAPASIVAGNALVLVIGVYPTASSFTLPTGFTQVRLDNTGANWTQMVACKTATGSEPSSYSISFAGGGSTSVGAILQLSNTNCSELDVNSGGFANSATTLTIPSVTTSQTNEYVLAAASWACADVPGINVGQIYINNGGFGRLTVSGYLQTAASSSPTPVVGPLNTQNCSPVTVTGQQLAFIPTTTVQAVPLITNQSGAQLSALNASVNNVLNVMAPPYRALGDGNTDDTNSIQQAIYDACGSNPPTFPGRGATKAVYLPAASVCYMHSKPLRIPCTNLELFGQGTGSKLCQNYTGEALLQNGWGVANLPTGAALVGSGNSLLSPGVGSIANSIDLSRFINGVGTNKLAAKVTGSGFNIAFFMKATVGGGQILGSHNAYPGTGNGAFSFIYNGSNQVLSSVNTVAGGLLTLTACPAQTLGSVYEIEMDWDKSTYRVWQGTPGGTAVLCGSSASANAMTQGPFEEVMLPDGGPHAFWPEGSSNVQNAFSGSLDSVRFEATSVHAAAYTVPNAKFSADNQTYYLQNFEPSLDGTQIGHTFNNTTVYSIVTGTTIGATGGDSIHDLELCSTAIGPVGGNPDGLWAAGGNGSHWRNLRCSNAYYSQFDFFSQDFLAHVDDLEGFGGHVGIVKGSQFADSIILNSGIDGTDVACEVAIGGGGGSYEEQHPRCVDRGGLRYGWIEDQAQGLINYPFVDQEAGIEPQFVATYLFNTPFGPYVVNGGNIDTRNAAPYVIQDNGGYGTTFLGMLFNVFGQDQPASAIVKYTNGNPATPTQLINTLVPAGVPLSNQAGNPNILSLGIGQSTVLQSLELQQAPKFDAGLNHLTVGAISDPTAPAISVAGATGGTSYGPYFVVCHDINGGVTNVSPASNTVANGPASLTGANFIQINWTANSACATWDVLKGNTVTSLTTGVNGSASSFSDIGQATASYTAPVRNNTGDINYGSILVSAGMTFSKLPGTVVNGGRFYCTDCDPPANPPVTCTHAGAKTGSWVDGLNGQWLCVP